MDMDCLATLLGLIDPEVGGMVLHRSVGSYFQSAWCNIQKKTFQTEDWDEQVIS